MPDNAPIVTNPEAARRSFRFRGRSFMALVLVPEPPVDQWLAELDIQMERSPAFFAGRPVVVEAAALAHERAALAPVVAALQARGIRIMGVEGADSAWPGFDALGLPPMMSGSKPVGLVEPQLAPPAAGPRPAAAPPPPAEEPPPNPQSAALLLDQPVRSGQSVVFPNGDLTVVGSVASGAEVVAGGSIHVYGALRGRAVAGAMGNPRARIFCRRLEAELLAIDGLYKTADDMDAGLRGKAVQIWLDGDTMMISALD